MRILVTGGAGFIGSNFIRSLLRDQPDSEIVNLDALTYAGNIHSLKDIERNIRYTFIHGDICDAGLVEKVFEKFRFDTIIHFAAESHVDRSIADPSVFLRTNVLGSNILLSCAQKFPVLRFIHISTDEVYGSTVSGSFKETDSLAPSSPYAASKAGSDLLAASYNKTFDVPVIVTRCTNNYGPYQYPEKLIPFFITNIIEGKKIPVYGTGANIRDWIHVDDHCRAILHILEKGKTGEIYNIGAGNERTNLEITKMILASLKKDESVIEYVKDRPGHDLRYSLDCSKLRAMGWKPQHSFDEGMADTIDWYVRNEWWWRPLKK